MTPLEGILLAETDSSSGRGVEDLASLSKSSSDTQMTKSVVGEAGGEKAGPGGGPVCTGEPGGARVEGGGSPLEDYLSDWGCA